MLKLHVAFTGIRTIYLDIKKKARDSTRFAKEPDLDMAAVPGDGC